ncbi:MAG TPA: ABC transporter substrate-binding protein, partial [Bauldia sp.]|nr:ABC transporter substrate-binding protein [Bauldia sp.]
MMKIDAGRRARLIRLSMGAVAASALVGLATSASAEPITIKQWNLKTEGYPEFIEFAKAEYKKTHPDVEIVFEDFPNEAYKTTIQVALVGSDPPDVFFNWSGEDAARLVRDGLALDITELGAMPGGFKENLS